jgi:hypothetical protein
LTSQSQVRFGNPFFFYLYRLIYMLIKKKMYKILRKIILCLLFELPWFYYILTVATPWKGYIYSAVIRYGLTTYRSSTLPENNSGCWIKPDPFVDAHDTLYIFFFMNHETAELGLITLLMLLIRYIVFICFMLVRGLPYCL